MEHLIWISDTLEWVIGVLCLGKWCLLDRFGKPIPPGQITLESFKHDDETLSLMRLVPAQAPAPQPQTKDGLTAAPLAEIKDVMLAVVRYGKAAENKPYNENTLTEPVNACLKHQGLYTKGESIRTLWKDSDFAGYKLKLYQRWRGWDHPEDFQNFQRPIV
jgi:hypothetical protein